MAALLSAALCTGSWPRPPPAKATQSYSLNFELKYQTDRRTRGVSDTYNDAGANSP